MSNGLANTEADTDLIEEVMPYLQAAYQSIDKARDIMVEREIALIGKDRSSLADHCVSGPPEKWIIEEDKKHNFDRDKFKEMIIEAKLAGGRYRVLLDKLLDASDAIIEVAVREDNDLLSEQVSE